MPTSSSLTAQSLTAQSAQHLVAHGTAVGLDQLDGLLFDIHAPHTYCRICGHVFQSEFDRNPEDYASPSIALAEVIAYATLKRKRWSYYHADTHSEFQHDHLNASGLWLMPEAAYSLAAFGIIPLIDLVQDDEVSNALREAPSLPAERQLCHFTK